MVIRAAPGIPTVTVVEIGMKDTLHRVRVPDMAMVEWHRTVAAAAAAAATIRRVQNEL